MKLETRKHKITYKIFNRTNIIDLAKVIYQEYNDDYNNFNEDPGDQYYYGRFKISVDYGDQEIQTDSLDILYEDSTFEYKEINEIDITFYSDYSDKDIKFIACKNPCSCYLNITGSDLKWVSRIENDLKSIVSHIEEQNNILLLNRVISSIIIAFFISISFFTCIIYLSILIRKDPLVINKKDLPFLVGFCVFITGIISIIIENTLNLLWPQIEFDFGIYRHNKAQRLRKHLWIFFTLIILPIIFMIIDKLII